ncbi:MAG: spermidine synthase [Phycisphaerales bacterium]
MRWLFTITIFVGAALLFLVQPMVAKLLLPSFGGSSFVWNTAMMFFQGTLLAGYAYAHLIGRGPARWWKTGLHALVLGVAIVSLPIAMPAAWVPMAEGSPMGPLLKALVLMAALPAAVMATTGPLIQAWYSRTGAADAKDPYFLYTASNAGSLVGLLGYPFVVERLIPLSEQGRVWTGAYVVYALLAITCGVVAAARGRGHMRGGAASAAAQTPAVAALVSWKDRGLWLLLAFAPSSLTLGATQYISTDVGSFPLLWILPLTAYIVSFMIAFSMRGGGVVAVCAQTIPVAAVLVGGTVMIGPGVRWVSDNLALMLALHVGLVLVGSIGVHAKLFAARPAAAHLTEFYLLIAVGGVAGGAFNALLAPVVFTRVWEYPLAIALVCVLGARGLGVPGVRWLRATSDRRWWRVALDVVLPLLVFLLGGLCLIVGDQLQLPKDFEGPMLRVVVPVLACLMLVGRPLRVGLGVLALFVVADRNQYFFAHVLHRVRTYYGVHMVFREPQVRQRTLSHGTTRHTVQSDVPEFASMPQAYYHPTSPIGWVFDWLEQRERPLSVALVGMGGGALAAYSREGDVHTFYEIDPEVRRIATNPALFTYVPDAKGRIEIVMGDARQRLGSAPDAAYDLIVLDAFSADSIPTHLVTVEAFATYLAKLRPDGLIAVHISNRFFELNKPLVPLAIELDLEALVWYDNQVTPGQAAQGKEASMWMLMGRKGWGVQAGVQPGSWRVPPPPGPGDRAWTDDFTNPLSALHAWW